MSYQCPVCGKKVTKPPYRTYSKAPHLECIIDNCTQTIRRGEKINNVQRNWIARLGFTPTEFKEGFVGTGYEGEIQKPK